MAEEPSKSRHVKLSMVPTKSLLFQKEEPPEPPPTTYCDTLIHLFKGNIGAGLFAMGDAFKNGGMAVAPVLTVVIGVICIHCMHILVKCSNRMALIRGDNHCTSFADTIEQCFENGPERLQRMSKVMKKIVMVFICVTQLGFCCIYIVFVATNVNQILAANGIKVNPKFIMLAAFVPILLTSLITNLKMLTPVSMFAGLCMIGGFVATMFFALKDGLPDVSERRLYTNVNQLGLFFGTAIFAFEGIAIVLPLKDAMVQPENFERLPFGVLNVGMFIVCVMFVFTGAVGYMKWGEDVGGSMTLNLGENVFALTVKGMVSCGILLGYPLQFFIAIQIMWSSIVERFNLSPYAFWSELSFRTFMVVVTLLIALFVPSLGLFISLIGALCSTSLALFFPPVIELLLRNENDEGQSAGIWIKNILIIMLALLGFATGTYESVYQIIDKFGDDLDDK